MNQINISRPGIVLLGALLLGAGLAGCAEEVQESVPRLRPVRSIVVHSGADALRDRLFTGTAQAAQESRLSFNVAGTVRELAVTVGDRLQPGQLIAALDPAIYEVEVQRARASLAQAGAERRNAEAEYQRVRQLYANDNASRNELDAALAGTESAKASHQAQSQSLQLAELNRGYTRLTSSGECSVATVDVEKNENVAAGAQVAILSCGDQWEVEIAVPESLIATFQPDMTGAVSFDAIPGQSFMAVVSEVGITAGGSTTFPVTLTLTERHSSFRSGLAAEVTFAFAASSSNENLVFLPPVAVGQDEQGAFVYVLEPGDEAGVAITRRRAVVVGALSESGLEITEGLIDGDRVVTAGITAARDGLAVRVD